MCGIALVISTKKEHKDEAKRIFRGIMIDNEERGRDSTGVLAITRGESKNDSPQYSLFKDTKKSSEFMGRKKFRKAEADIWIGHTRWATLGAVTERNAHPLQRGNVILVHNGMISNHDVVAKEFNMKYQVDSEVLLPIVESERWEDLKKITGSANFIAWNTKKQKIYVERHINPLFLLTLPQLGIKAYSSKREILDMLTKYLGDGIVTFVSEDTLSILDMMGDVETSQTVEYKSYSTIPATRLPSYRVADDYDDDDDWNEYSNYNRRPTPTYKELAKADEEHKKYKKDGAEVLEDYLNKIDKEDSKGYLSASLFCEACGMKITETESDISVQEYGHELCYLCQSELEDAWADFAEFGEVDMTSENRNLILEIFEELIPVEQLSHIKRRPEQKALSLMY